MKRLQPSGPEIEQPGNIRKSLKKIKGFRRNHLINWVEWLVICGFPFQCGRNRWRYRFYLHVQHVRRPTILWFCNLPDPTCYTWINEIWYYSHKLYHTIFILQKQITNKFPPMHTQPEFRREFANSKLAFKSFSVQLPSMQLCVCVCVLNQSTTHQNTCFCERGHDRLAHVMRICRRYFATCDCCLYPFDNKKGNDLWLLYGLFSLLARTNNIDSHGSSSQTACAAE